MNKSTRLSPPSDVATSNVNASTARINRRQLLGGTAAAAISLTSLGAALGRAETSTDRWRMKLSTSSLHYRSLSVTEACQRIGALGFEAIDIWSHFEWAGPLCEHLEDALDKIGPDKFAELLKEQKLRLASVSCYSVPFSRFAEKLGKLGGTVVIRGSGNLVAADGNSTNASELVRQMKQFLESLKPELELAEQFNCTLAIENHSGASLLNRLDSFKAFTDLNKSNRLGIALAPYHVQLNGESVEQAIRVAASQLKFFYAWQHGEGTDQLPGIGKTDVRPWLRALASIDYQGHVNPFMHHEPEPEPMSAALAKSRKYLQSAFRDVSA